MGFSGGSSFNPVTAYQIAVPVTTSYGALTVGPGPFSLSASGTVIAGGAASGFSGDLVNMQVAGSSLFKVASNGQTTIHAGILNGSGGAGISFDSVGANINAVNSKTYAPLRLFVQATGTADIFQIDNTNGSVVLFGVTVAGEAYMVGLAPTTTAYSAVHTLTTADSTSEDNATGGAYAVTLPAASAAKLGRIYTVKKMDSSANAVTITAAGTDTIEGAATIALTTQYAYRMVQRNAAGNGWNIIGGSLT